MKKDNMTNFFHNRTKGQIQLSLATILMGISFVVAPVITYFSAQAATKTEISNVSERTARLETFVPTIDKRLENIERALKISPQ